MTRSYMNLTPHTININIRPVGHSGNDIAIPPSGKVARVSQTPGELRDIDMDSMIEVWDAPTMGPVEGLPGPDDSPGTLYIVSAIVLAQCAGRTDVVAPGTGPADGPVRDEAGRIVAVRRLVGAPK